MTAMLRAEKISVKRAGRLTLEPCSLSIEAGDRLAVYGPNGAGKSTLLQAAAGLLPIATGSIVFRGKTVGREMPLLDYHRQTAAVFQEPLLLRGTVRHNIELGLKLRGVAAEERARRALAWMERLRITHLARRPASLLSGGEAQRTSLARALVLEPEMLFLDEPFAALDAPTRGRLLGELAEILDEQRIATLFVTHDLGEAAELCERCLVLDNGRPLQQDAMTAVMDRPLSRRVAEIIGARNVFDGVIVGENGSDASIEWSGHRIRTSLEGRAGATVTFMLREERLKLGAPSGGTANEVRGRVQRVRRRAANSLVSVRVGNPHSIQLRCENSERPSLDQEVTISFPPEAVWILPQQRCCVRDEPA
jgi:tungstate transport system ATP-binding protein